MPVWAVKSSANSVAWIPESSRFSNSALFSVEDVEARTENLIGALADVEDHFGPDSFPQNPYTAIYVIGIDLSAAIRERLASEGFRISARPRMDSRRTDRDNPRFAPRSSSQS